jgi:hypothetical protein
VVELDGDRDFGHNAAELRERVCKFWSDLATVFDDEQFRLFSDRARYAGVPRQDFCFPVGQGLRFPGDAIIGLHQMLDFAQGVIPKDVMQKSREYRFENMPSKLFYHIVRFWKTEPHICRKEKNPLSNRIYGE